MFSKAYAIDCRRCALEYAWWTNTPDEDEAGFLMTVRSMGWETTDDPDGPSWCPGCARATRRVAPL